MAGEFIDRWVDDLDGKFVSAIEAERLMRDTPREQMDAYFGDRDVRLRHLTDEISRRSRKAPRETATRQTFGRAARAASEAGDLVAFGESFAINAENVRLVESRMYAADHLFVASERVQRGNTELMLAEFHRAVARKIGERRTDEVFDAAGYAELRASIVGHREVSAA